MAGFFADLYDGKVEGLNSVDYYDNDGVFSGYKIGSDGYYHFNISYHLASSPQFSYQSVDAFCSGKVACFKSGNSCYWVQILSNGTFSSSWAIRFNYYENNVFLFSCSNQFAAGFSAFKTDIPLFSSEAEAHNFLLNGTLTGLLNGEAYDFPELTKSAPTVMLPLTGYEFAPGRLPGINAALSTAAAALPEPGLDPAENTEAYKKTLNAALTAALPEPAPEPEPDPDPSPSPDPGTGGEGESYKRDLKLLFPFCIPFDFIHLIQALKAEPETPKFEIPVKLDFVDVDTSIVIDLAWMDPIMKIWRLGELGLFIVMLMKSTSKVIRW